MTNIENDTIPCDNSFHTEDVIGLGSGLRYDPAVHRPGCSREPRSTRSPPALSLRDDAFNDVALLKSAKRFPPRESRPDSGFIDLPTELLAEFRQKGAGESVGKDQKPAACEAAR